MGLYFLKRLAQIVFTIWIMSLVIFGISQVLPGNVAYVIAGQFATADQVAAIERRLGLDAPVAFQYFRWIGSALKGDFGTSFTMSRPVGPMIVEALLQSVQLAGAAFLMIAVIGVALGVISALNKGALVDKLIVGTSWFLVAIPQFFLGIALILLFSGELGLLPATGYARLSDGFFNWLSHLILPVVTLFFGLVSHVTSLQRASMIEALSSMYVRAARAKGLSETKVIVRHALRNALIPTITVLSLDLGLLIGGIVVVETVFSYPGLGRLMVTAIEQKDLPLLQAGVLVVTVIYAFANLIADLSYAALDPRVRLNYVQSR